MSDSGRNPMWSASALGFSSIKEGVEVTTQKLTLTVVRRKDGERRFVLSNFTPVNEAVLRCYGLLLDVSTM